MNKYKKLISNTILFAVGTFSSKVLVILLLPLYTYVLPPAEFGMADNLVQASNLILPLITVGTLNGIIRFGLDRSVRKTDVFTTGFMMLGIGFTSFLLLWPLMDRISFITGYTGFVYLYALCSALRSLCSQFVRAQERVRLYAIDGVLATVLVLGFNVLFLVVFPLGIVGYILATILSDLCSALFLFISAKLWRFIRVRPGMSAVSRAILRYSVPLIPTTICWWITNISGRYIITAKLGESALGLFITANKLPMMIVLVANVFNDAWQMSAITDSEGEAGVDFFNKVFRAFVSVMFLAASGIILFSKVIIRILVTTEAYYPAWEYVPITVMATVFSCIVTFLGSVYIVKKRSVGSLVTTMAGALLNVVLCFWLIPIFGVNGAALAMLVSYFTVFVMRAVSARRMMHMTIGAWRVGINLLLVSAQAFIMINELPYWALWEILLTGVVAAYNLRPIVAQLAAVLAARKALKRPQ